MPQWQCQASSSGCSTELESSSYWTCCWTTPHPRYLTRSQGINLIYAQQSHQVSRFEPCCLLVLIPSVVSSTVGLMVAQALRFGVEMIPSSPTYPYNIYLYGTYGISAGPWVSPSSSWKSTAKELGDGGQENQPHQCDICMHELPEKFLQPSCNQTHHPKHPLLYLSLPWHQMRNYLKDASSPRMVFPKDKIRELWRFLAKAWKKHPDVGSGQNELGREMQLVLRLIKCLAQEDEEVTFLQGLQGRITWIKAPL